ncbi:MAG: 4-phosphoerythronate dehydrogenase PdxB [Deltaproteobacteria bacterium]|jgi:erythronate-4-phosphate dehydrogenase|nr:4-phosphoerythronate dehydrogenase PdxB [Deltaproteobacteria bacterium]MBT4527667.1 4-phosphoerythronate dehydrogenase PdxB [Deltaproteobacteria bacterium]
MKIVVDDKIPFIRGILEIYGKVIYAPGGAIDNEMVKDTDAIIIRTRTKCNKQLLKNSSVKFIATATIGYDHIDKDYCSAHNIKWVNAPGCNAKSVEQYMTAALLYLHIHDQIELKGKTLGVVGVGNTGSKTAKIAEILGMNVLLNDPPRARQENSGPFVSLKEIIAHADFICFHVPLNREGVDQTYHLVDQSFIDKVSSKVFLMSTCRGEVIDNQVLKSALNLNQVQGAVLDVWENEPTIDLELMDLCKITTPHIAGYSADGKVNGTENSVRALSQFFNLDLNKWKCPDIPVPHAMEISIDGKGKPDEQILFEAVHYTYPIEKDDEKLRQSTSTFEKQRGDYPIRREFNNYKVRLSNGSEKVEEQLKKLGFII